MKHLFIPYELAVIAKEKEFNEYCSAEYDKVDKHLVFVLKPSLNSQGSITAPLYQQIVDWFRIEHHLEIWVEFSQECFCYEYQILSNISSDPWVGAGSFESYYDALNKAMEEAFKLI